MRGDLGSALVRAYVRGERVKRAHGPSSPLWQRWVRNLRPRIVLAMSEREAEQAMELVNLDRRANPHGRPISV